PRTHSFDLPQGSCILPSAVWATGSPREQSRPAYRARMCPAAPTVTSSSIRLSPPASDLSPGEMSSPFPQSHRDWTSCPPAENECSCCLTSGRCGKDKPDHYS